MAEKNKKLKRVRQIMQEADKKKGNVTSAASGLLKGALGSIIGLPMTGKKGESAEERRIRMRDQATDATAKKMRKMIDEETKKKRKGKQVKGTLTAKKGGLIKSKKKAVKKFRGDGIVKKGKTKCKMR